MSINVQIILLVILTGCVGGFVNAIVVGRGRLRPPGIINLGHSGRLVELGWIGNVIIGGAAAFAVWGTGLGNPNPPQVYATALISGFGGARILNDLLEKQGLNTHINSLANKIKDLIEKEE